MIPNLKYFFGKMTMYPSFDREARDMILYFLKRHFGDRDGLITVSDPVLLERPKKSFVNSLSKTISAPTIRFSIVPCANAASTSRRLSAPT